MALQSAGVLLYRIRQNGLEVMLVHPGGPFWAKKNEGAWSIPKGLLDRDEDGLDGARREFQEETGLSIDGQFIELGEVKQPGGKIVRAWAIEKDLDVSEIKSNFFTIEWPKNSGNFRKYPEVDRAGWFGIDEAKKKILKGQIPLLDRLETLILIDKPREDGL